MDFVGTIWSLLPAIVAIGLALKTKEVYLSLFLGIVAGALLFTNFNLLETTHLIFDTMGAELSGNIGIIIFLVFLGIIVILIGKAGGSKAYGDFMKTKIKGRKGAQYATFGLGCLIFVDDYFNCLTVGSVMRSVTDNFKISRAKLAYIIDSTAAPICIIAPISSWAAAVTGYTEGDGFQLFLQTIPYNLYAILTIIMVIYVIQKDVDFGLMKDNEIAAKDGDVHFGLTDYSSAEEIKANENGTILDLVLPVIFLILSCVIAMLYTGGFFTGVDIITAFSSADAVTSLVFGSFFTLIFIFILYVPRKLVSYRDFADSIPEGFKTMVSAIVILTLAWTLGNIVSESLQAGVFVENALTTMNLSTAILPVVFFIVATGLAFSTGTSWGTFGVLIPIATAIFPESTELLVICISSILAGAVCGDHISPISDTTIMASAGAQCNHINHVATQTPYAMLVAISCVIGYAVAGLTQNVFLTFIAGLVSLFIILFVREKLVKAK